MSELEKMIEQYAAMWAGTGIFFSKTAVTSYSRLLGKYEKFIIERALTRALKESPEKPMAAPALRHLCEEIKKGQDLKRALPPPEPEPELPPLPPDSPFAKLEAEWRKNPPTREDDPAGKIVEVLCGKM